MINKPKKKKYRKSKKIIVDGLEFDSKFESNIYNILLEFFDAKYIKRQVKYFHDRLYTCDFVIVDYFIKPVWIECSTYKRKRYLAKIERKRKWVNERGHYFVFFNGLRTAKAYIQEGINLRNKKI